MTGRFTHLTLTQIVVAAACLTAHATPLYAGRLFVGGATTSITPDAPVLLDGQRRARISTAVESPCMATALAVETRDGNRSIAQAVFVSCDLTAIRGGDDFYGEVRRAVQGRVPEHLLGRIILNATHTHTAPVTDETRYETPQSGVMPPAVYRKFLFQRLGDVVVEAWNNRAPARVAWGLGHAVVAQNRRAIYSDGSAVMYGKSNRQQFRGLEGNEDHGVEFLYFWNAQDELIATAINVACPSQVVEARTTVNADFWHPVRERLRRKHGDSLLVLGWTGASGDQSPRPMYRKAAEERMRRLRGVDQLDELARRIAAAHDDVYQVVAKERHEDIVMEHRIETVELPYRRITEPEAAAARQELARLEKANGADAAWNRRWHQGAVERYERQQAGLPNYDMQLHVVRLGDVAIVTNDFELFTDFGVQIKARSPALQTFIVQLCGAGLYVPTERAVQGAGYGAIPQTNIVGPTGAQVLVDETVRLLDALWNEKPAGKASARR